MNLFLTLPYIRIPHCGSHMAKGGSPHKLHGLCQALLPASSLWLRVNLLVPLAGCSMTCSPYLLLVCLLPSFLCSYPVQSVSFFFSFFSVQWFCSSPILHGFSRPLLIAWIQAMQRRLLGKVQLVLITQVDNFF